MASRLIALVAGTLVALNVSAVSAAEPPRAPGSAPVHEVNVDANGLIRVHEQGTVMSQVTNFPLDPGGNLRVSGDVGVSGTVGATQSGPWSVGLDPAASSFLSNIDTATSGLNYDTDGYLKVSMAPTTSAADPSVADRSPFGFSAGSSFTGTIIVQTGPPAARLTAYFFETDHDLTVTFEADESVIFGFIVRAGHPVTASFHHAILADAMRMTCMGGNTCAVTRSVAGY